MPCAQTSRVTGEPTIDRNDLDAERGERRVNLRRATSAQRPHDHLGVHAGRDHHSVAALLDAPQQPASGGMMSVVAIEEADQNVGVERYRSHSSRSRWR